LTPQQLSTIAIRLFVLWYATFLIRELPGSFFAEFEATGAIVPAKIFVAILLVIIAVLLWFAATFLARHLVPHSVTQTPLPWTESQVLTVGASLIGLWLVSYTLHPIFYYGTLLLLSSKMPGWDTGHTISLVSALAVCAVGLWLFLGASGLWQVWARLRGRAEN
jgi:hypothetical protein